MTQEMTPYNQCFVLKLGKSFVGKRKERVVFEDSQVEHFLTCKKDLHGKSIPRTYRATEDRIFSVMHIAIQCQFK